MVVRDGNARKASHLHNFPAVRVPTNALCAWLIQSGGTRPDGGLDEKATGHVRQTSVGDTNAAKGKIWQLEIKSTAYPPPPRHQAARRQTWVCQDGTGLAGFCVKWPCNTDLSHYPLGQVNRRRRFVRLRGPGSGALEVKGCDGKRTLYQSRMQCEVSKPQHWVCPSEVKEPVSTSWTAGSHRLVSYHPDFLLGPDES